MDAWEKATHEEQHHKATHIRNLQMIAALTTAAVVVICAVFAAISVIRSPLRAKHARESGQIQGYQKCLKDVRGSDAKP